MTAWQLDSSAPHPHRVAATTSVDVAALRARLLPHRRELDAATPFPHLVLDDFLPEPIADALAAEFDDPALPWQALHHVNERKRVCGDLSRLGPVARAVVHALHGAPMLRTLGQLTGLDRLTGDPELDGAGLHETGAGGHLGVHADALAHAKRRTWSRQLNVIVFLNRDWQDAWNGALELWDRDVRSCVRRIPPAFNRAVLFRTTRTSFHGVPEGVTCPPGRARRSLALYYYRDESRTVPLRPTRYVPRPGDSLVRRALIHADRTAIALYALLKRYTPLDDARVARILAQW